MTIIPLKWIRAEVMRAKRAYGKVWKSGVSRTARLAFTERTRSKISTGKFQKCFQYKDMIVPNSKDYFDNERKRINEPPVRLLGITTDCFVYYGWLHQFITQHIRREEDLGWSYSGACRDFKPFIIRTVNEGKKELLFVAVKRHGRRLLVQSIARDFLQYTSEDTAITWAEMNPFARHEQFLSNEFPTDFTFESCNNLLYRIFVMGHSTSKTKILELKVSIDKHKNLIPFITKVVLDVDPLVHVPMFGSTLIAAHDFKIGNMTE
ncbi:hypothetical protein Y032_0022g574 [Ancylostoma ceylanicum]|nr:hypothetical protein Y032_0022g574 [Ancylostoma ceylanicum]